jgi:DNA polymerase III sliding clamp (beta) subunit (PCNA family)
MARHTCPVCGHTFTPVASKKKEGQPLADLRQAAVGLGPNQLALDSGELLGVLRLVKKLGGFDFGLRGLRALVLDSPRRRVSYHAPYVSLHVRSDLSGCLPPVAVPADTLALALSGVKKPTPAIFTVDAEKVSLAVAQRSPVDLPRIALDELPASVETDDMTIVEAPELVSLLPRLLPVACRDDSRPYLGGIWISRHGRSAWASDGHHLVRVRASIRLPIADLLLPYAACDVAAAVTGSVYLGYAEEPGAKPGSHPGVVLLRRGSVDIVARVTDNPRCNDINQLIPRSANLDTQVDSGALMSAVGDLLPICKRRKDLPILGITFGPTLLLAAEAEGVLRSAREVAHSPSPGSVPKLVAHFNVSYLINALRALSDYRTLRVRLESGADPMLLGEPDEDCAIVMPCRHGGETTNEDIRRMREAEAEGGQADTCPPGATVPKQPEEAEVTMAPVEKQPEEAEVTMAPVEKQPEEAEVTMAPVEKQPEEAEAPVEKQPEEAEVTQASARSNVPLLTLPGSSYVVHHGRDGGPPLVLRNAQGMDVPFDDYAVSFHLDAVHADLEAARTWASELRIAGEAPEVCSAAAGLCYDLEDLEDRLRAAERERRTEERRASIASWESHLRPIRKSCSSCWVESVLDWVEAEYPTLEGDTIHFEMVLAAAEDLDLQEDAQPILIQHVRYSGLASGMRVAYEETETGIRVWREHSITEEERRSSSCMLCRDTSRDALRTRRFTSIVGSVCTDCIVLAAAPDTEPQSLTPGVTLEAALEARMAPCAARQVVEEIEARLRARAVPLW